MFIDASALTAILAQEADAALLLNRLEKHPIRITSPIAVWETTVAIARLLRLEPQEAEFRIEQFMAEMGIHLTAISTDATTLAIEAYHRFGKSRHPAALNMGDCFAYACARHARVPLLYKGGDFAKTDIEPA